MAIKGGYQILDFGGVNFVTDGSGSANVKDVLEAIRGMNGKLAIFHALSIDGVEMDDFAAQIGRTGNDDGYECVIDLYIDGSHDSYVFTIEDDSGECSFVKEESPGPGPGPTPGTTTYPRVIAVGDIPANYWGGGWKDFFESEFDFNVDTGVTPQVMVCLAPKTKGASGSAQTYPLIGVWGLTTGQYNNAFKFKWSDSVTLTVTVDKGSKKISCTATGTAPTEVLTLSLIALTDNITGGYPATN